MLDREAIPQLGSCGIGLNHSVRRDAFRQSSFEILKMLPLNIDLNFH